MPKESNLEVKVGAFVVIAVVCLVAFVFSISDFSVFKKGVVYHVKFQYANGLKKGAPVRLAGVDAGHVSGIKVMASPGGASTMNVVVDMWMEQGNNVPADSKFLINQLGLLGEKYLEIMPGSSPELLSQGAVVFGEEPVPLEKVIKLMGVLGSKVEATLDQLNNGILTEANKKAFTAVLVNMAAVADNINNGVLTPANKASLATTLANFAAVSENVKNGQGTVGKFLMDPGVYRNLDELSADLKMNPWKLFYRPKK